MLNIYEKAVEQLKPEHIDHHGTDLYLKATEKSRKLVSEYEYKRFVTTFIDNIEHKRWYDIPFAYSPGWIKDPKTGEYPL